MKLLIHNHFSTVILLVFCPLILVLSIRGIAGNPVGDTLNTPNWRENGPLELSPDRGRFALLESIVENKSFYFSLPIARFATPDLGYKNGHYVSLFDPGVSFLIIPGYVIGKMFDLSQVGSFAVIALFAFLNMLLLRAIAIRLKVPRVIATLVSLLFLFATPAFPYAVSLYQHHISTFLMLLSIYILLRWKGLWPLFIIWFLCAASISIDYPNLLFMFPIGIYALGRLVSFKKVRRRIILRFKYLGIITFLTLLLPIAFFLWVNKISYGSPFQLAGTVASVKAIDANGKPSLPKNITVANADNLLNPSKQKKSVINFFQTRDLLNGFFEHFTSRDRGMIWFTPVMFFSIAGIFVLYRRDKNISALFLAIIASDILLYSMWGDPYGGWAFGSRYLIPSYAVMSLFIALALERYRKNIIFLLVFFVILAYSISVNTVGALTSNANPPQAEVLALEKLSGKVQKYSYDRSIDFLKSNQSKSFIWQTYARKHITATNYFFLLDVSIIAVSFGLLLIIWLQRKQKEIV